MDDKMKVTIYGDFSFLGFNSAASRYYLDEDGNIRDIRELR